MEYLIDNSFIRDVKKAPEAIQKQVAIILAEMKTHIKIAEIPKVKKLSGARNAYALE